MNATDLELVNSTDFVARQRCQGRLGLELPSGVGASLMGRKRKAEAALGAPGHAKIHVGVSTLKQGKCLDRGLTDNRVAASGKVEAPSMCNGNEKFDGLTVQKDAGPLDKHGATSAITEGTGSPGSPGVARLDSSSLTPQRLWDDFISRRLPAVVSGYPQDPSWRASQLWTLDYLERQAVRSRFQIIACPCCGKAM